MFKFSTTHLIQTADDVKVAWEKEGGALVVGTNNKIKHGTVIDEIRKVEPTLPEYDAVKFTPDVESGKLHRLYIYIRSVENADPLWANDWIYKGKPFMVEYKTLDDIVDTINSANGPFRFGKAVAKAVSGTTNATITKYDKSSIDAPGAGKVLIQLQDPNLRFHMIQILKFEGEGDGGDLVYYANGGFVVKKTWMKGADNSKNSLSVDSVTKGSTGFGTFDYLTHNLRLPTNANTRLYRDLADEMPVKGVNYTQYILKTCTERPEMQGTSVLGQYNKSITTHIFWVAASAVTGFENKLIEALNYGSTITGEDKKTYTKGDPDFEFTFAPDGDTAELETDSKAPVKEA